MDTSIKGKKTEMIKSDWNDMKDATSKTAESVLVDQDFISLKYIVL